MGGPAYINNIKFKQFDNFYETTVPYDGLIYPSVENAFQAQKSHDNEYRKKLRTVDPWAAYNLGQTIELREDWERVKVGLMEDIVFHRFLRDVGAILSLISTKGDIEFRHSSDFWNKENARILTRWRDFFTMKMRGVFKWDEY